MQECHDKKIRSLVLSLTGKRVYITDQESWYRQSLSSIEVSETPRHWTEGVLHEVCHWVVAPPWCRDLDDNLGMGHSFDGYDGAVLALGQQNLFERSTHRLQATLLVVAGEVSFAREVLASPWSTKPLPVHEWRRVQAAANVAGWDLLTQLARRTSQVRRKELLA